jgi:hypothetical protein
VLQPPVLAQIQKDAYRRDANVLIGVVHQRFHLLGTPRTHAGNSIRCSSAQTPIVAAKKLNECGQSIFAFLLCQLGDGCGTDLPLRFLIKKRPPVDTRGSFG